MNRVERTKGRAAAFVCRAVAAAMLTGGAAFAQGAPPEEPPPTAPRPPLAESLRDAAKSDYESARVLYRNGDAAGAIIKFQRAYDASKDARLLWNVAVCYKNLHRYVKMIETLERYRREGSSEPALTPAELAEADGLIEAARQFMGSFTLEVNEPEASVTLDDEAVGPTPLPAPLRLDLGAHQVVVSKAGYVTRRQAIEVVGGELVALRVVLVREGRLVVRAPADALVAVDDRPVGRGPWEGGLASGRHTVRVTAGRKVPYQTSLTVDEGHVVTMNVSLTNEASAGAGSLPWVMGGAALMAGAVVGGYFLFRKPDSATSLPTATFGTTRQPSP